MLQVDHSIRQAKVLTAHPSTRSLCQSQHDRNRSIPEPDRSLVALERDLLQKFVGLHGNTFSDAAISYIISQGGMQDFDFRGRLMCFELHRRDLDDNPGTAFSVAHAECPPIDKGLSHPQIRVLLQEMEERYNSVERSDKATMENFKGLLMTLFTVPSRHAILKHISLCDNPDVRLDFDHENWLSRLQYIVNNKEVGNTVQVGKIVRQGTQWKWAAITGPIPL
jgi:hypothetical protein